MHRPSILSFLVSMEGWGWRYPAHRGSVKMSTQSPAVRDSDTETAPNSLPGPNCCHAEGNLVSGDIENTARTITFRSYLSVREERSHEITRHKERPSAGFLAGPQIREPLLAASQGMYQQGAGWEAALKPRLSILKCMPPTPHFFFSLLG